MKIQIKKTTVSKVLIYITLLALVSCIDNNKKDFKAKKEEILKTEKANTNYISTADIEKITLLSIAKNIPQNQVRKILNDYYEKTLVLNDKEIDYNKIIDNIAKENNVTKQKVASIIFSFQYEQITEDEIINKYSSEREDYQLEKESPELDQY